MKKLSMLGIVGGAALLTAVPFSLQWSQKNVALSFDSAEARIGRAANCDERCRRQPKGSPKGISARSSRNRNGWISIGPYSTATPASYLGHSAPKLPGYSPDFGYSRAQRIGY
jgi:hypothetical protein